MAGTRIVPCRGLQDGKPMVYHVVIVHDAATTFGGPFQIWLCSRTDEPILTRLEQHPAALGQSFMVDFVSTRIEAELLVGHHFPQARIEYFTVVPEPLDPA